LSQGMRQSLPGDCHPCPETPVTDVVILYSAAPSAPRTSGAICGVQ
jgi:hypothetical protein